MSFENLIGNEKIKKELIEILKTNSVVHSYMFIGQEGIGKKKFATEFAKMILCSSESNQTCNTCSSYIKFLSGNHPDYFCIEPDGNTMKIAQIRSLQENIYEKPILSDKKVYIINDADKMTTEAQNALLKTLEEPPEYVVIILIVSNENILLTTIKSRCMRINFNNIEKQELVKYIKQNNIISNPSENIVEFCNGSLAKLEKVKDKLEEYEFLQANFEKLLKKQEKSIIDVLNNFELLYKNKDDIQSFLEYIIVITYNLIKNNEIEKKYISAIDIIENARRKLNSNSNYDMTIDEMLLKLWEI